ncbi:helix-turn-helix transcriptional regulator, partial [Rivihabitans pingtungensis]
MAIVFHIAESYSYKSSDICTLSLMIGHRIREARKQRGYNQQWLAEQIGVSQPSVSDWESGRNDPTMDNLAMAARVLDV